MALGLRPAPDMNEDEVARWLAGREDWAEDDWEDHCGRPGCDVCYCDPMPMGSSSKAAIRKRWENS